MDALYCPVCDQCTKCKLQFQDVFRHGEHAVDSFAYGIYRCCGCGLVFMYPKPGPDVLGHLYSPEYGPYELQNLNVTRWKFKLARWRFADWPDNPRMAGRIQRVTAAVIEMLLGRRVPHSMGVPLYMPKNANILEIGHGSGYWLLAMSWAGCRNLWGLDIDASAKERLAAAGVKVLVGDVLELDLPEVFFDCIRLEHVFEHLSQPRIYLTRLAELLTPSGYLVLNMPNIDSLSYSLFHRSWEALSLPYHIYHWSPKTFGMLAESVGLKLVASRTLPVWGVFVASLRLAVSNGFPRDLGDILHGPLGRPLSPLYGLVCDMRNAGDYFSIVLARQ